MINKALVLGAGGFIGSHLVKRLKQEGFYVRGVDLKHPEFSPSEADDFIVGDLRKIRVCDEALLDTTFDEVYQLAADMGGAGFVFTKENDADILHNSTLINLNVLENISKFKTAKRIFFSSSACIYPERNQLDPNNPNCREDTAYPAHPDSDYGWEKLYSERLYDAYARNYNLEVRVGRYHNIFGPEGTWQGGREKAPAAICRKVAECKNGQSIQLWGDGKQTRSFLYIDECIEGTFRLMRSNFKKPVNIGSDQMISIEDLAKMIIEVSGKEIDIEYIDGPMGVKGRNSDNRLIEQALGWKPTSQLKDGIDVLYRWVEQQVKHRP